MSGWRLWAAQVLAIMRLEVKKTFARKGTIPVYLLAFAPVLLFAVHATLHARGWDTCSGSEDLVVYAGVFQVFMLRAGIFFGAVAIFMNLFRGEVLDKSLHYYFLAPVRREVLMAGKFLSGLVVAVVIYTVGTVLSYWILINHLELTKARTLAGPAMGDLPAYVGVTVLACIGYGALFLLMGMFFKNPIIPAALILLWESFIVFLPPLLKKFSVIFYLESLCPVRVPFDGGGAIFAVSADPTPAYIAIPGLLLLSAAIVLAAGLSIRRMEIRYGLE
jgi:ABC-type transport system involved in multi-copper enzyme maturation permease subunit